MKPKLSVVRTPNFEVMREFYLEKLRLRALSPMREDRIHFKDAGTEIFLERAADSTIQCASPQVRFFVEDVEGLVETFKARGVPVAQDETQRCIITDPDGNLLLIAHRSEIEG